MWRTNTSLDHAVVFVIEISSLVEDMHRCADNVIDLFSGKLAATTDSPAGQTSLITNPARLCYVVKQAMREAAVGECDWAGMRISLLGWPCLYNDEHIAAGRVR